MTKQTRAATFAGIACATVGILAAFGKFDSMRGFPIVFALIVLGGSLVRLWRERRLEGVALPAAILFAGVSLAFGGWAVRGRTIEERLADRRLDVLEEIHGHSVPSLEGLEPLNAEQAVWDDAASFTATATVVTFWARWCSPCWKEMEELEELYRQHLDRGLRVVAVTRYDRPDDQEERRSDFAKAQRFLADRRITYPTAITDRDDVYRAYRVPSPPGMALIDAQGLVVDYAISLESARSLMQKAAALAAEKPAG